VTQVTRAFLATPRDVVLTTERADIVALVAEAVIIMTDRMEGADQQLYAGRQKKVENGKVGEPGCERL
jgi:hypothetical protein